MFEIDFTKNGQRDCTVVHIKIDLDLPIEQCILDFTWECSTQYAAELLKRHLSAKYLSCIKNAHKKAYLQGYKDGRGKQKKKTYFSDSFGGECVAC